MSNKKEIYGPPLEESSSKRITSGELQKSITGITAKQVLMSPSVSSSLETQNKFTPLTPLALPSFYPSNPRAIRPSFQSKLISPLNFALATPSSLMNPIKPPEKLKQGYFMSLF